ncbi:uncharacterized protein LOC125226055 [Leguminivora glycinivorella]|uniref:uncharacterized protein LOC125226055 n=1 Tax=Leguminivora glycinivorella TaxID=1035111 RepID=UPI00200EF154|nr:uncharacterized protein LOC125226055 [Leguminivora glycinivorella]
MLQLLLVALLASAAVAEEAKPAEKSDNAVPLEAKPSENAEQTVMKDAESTHRGRLDHYDQYDHGDHNLLYLKAKLDGPESHREGPIVARNLPSDHGKSHANIAEQDEIIKFTYSPAYYEPIWALDYRFLKSGGRRYTRGPGGQVLILPRSYKHYKGDGTGDYDQLVEYWRLKLIAEQNKRMHQNGLGGHGHGHGHDHGHHGHEEYEHDVRRELHWERENLHHGREYH